MVLEVEKPRVTEIKVRMDCNGCVQKVKKALNGITGIYDICIDFPEQKITIIGWADPVKIVKAIKKTRKSAIICSHTEQSDQPAQQAEPEGGTAEGGAPPPESNNAPTEQPQAEAAPPADGQNEPPPPPPPPPDNPPPEQKPLPESANEATNQPIQHSKPEELEEIHVIYHHPPDYGYRYAYGHYQQPGNGAQWNAYPSGPGIRVNSPQPVQPNYVTHSHNTYRPSAYVTEYVCPQSAPGYSHYSRLDNYSQGYYSGNINGSITSMFSEENPNACCIV